MSYEEQRNYTFTWRIKNYSSCYQQKGEGILSPFFNIENIPDYCWRLKIYPRGTESSTGDRSFLSCFLERKALNKTFGLVKLSFSIELLDEKDRVLNYIHSNNTEFLTESATFGWKEFFSVSELDDKISSWAKDILTLRFRTEIDRRCKHRRMATVFNPLHYETIACTNIAVLRRFVGWLVKIPNLSGHSERLRLPNHSAFFELFELELVSLVTVGAILFLIHIQKDHHHVSQNLSLKFSVFDKIGSKLVSKRATCQHENLKSWTFPNFFTKEILKSCQVDSSHYEFKVECEVSISERKMSSVFEKLELVTPRTFTRNDFPSAMREEFRNIFMSQNYSDVVIRTNNCEFPAHKFVLRLRSPVLAAMFDQDMLESRTDVVYMDDVDEKTLRAFLEFLYTESVDKMDYDVAKTLIITADKYQVPSLVDRCVLFLKSILSTENVCEIIIIADLIGCEHLKSYSVNFIKLNASKILSTPLWMEWIEKNIKLATHVLSSLSVALSIDN